MPENDSNNSFDFDSHRRYSIEAYQKIRPLYEEYSDKVKSILKESLSVGNIKVASIEARAKSVISFGDKATEPSFNDPDQPKYKNPLKEITDLAGVRVITFFPKTVDAVDIIIKSEFNILEKSDKADLLKEQEKLGYQSVHYLVSLKTNRTKLPEYHPFENLIAEIQVRTIMQHAWAEIEHDIQYKSVEIIPKSIRRRFMSLAGLLEIADREFQAIQDADERLTQEARVSVREGNFENVEITPDALKTYLDAKIGADGRMTSFSYSWFARTLLKLGFINFKQIEECITPYDDDKLSRIVWGTRQGQLSRFELQILVGMGDIFLLKHPWAQYTSFTSRRKEMLSQMEAKGIHIGNYNPSIENENIEK